MPEIGEVARIVHYIRKYLVNKTITKVTANVDEIVYGKVGTSAAEFEKHMSGKKIVDVGQQGKYFWMIMSSPPHPVMHFGMSGWFKIKSEHTYYYRKKENEPKDEWPPKYLKFMLTAEGNGETEEAAFVDGRRLGRVRLVHCDGKDIRKHSPLKENGPDPVIDKELVSLEWLTEKCNKKKVPIKAMLLDQAVISGIGNWVGDEIMYNSKIHPEQYANTLNNAQIKQLHKSIHYVCGLACELLADSDQFPEDWLFKHRWGKGKKTGNKTLPNGNKIEFLTVGGRTSAVVPAVQKKTGPVAKDVGEDDAASSESEEKVAKPKKAVGKKRKAKDVGDEDEGSEEVETPAKKPAVKKGKVEGAKADVQKKTNGVASEKGNKAGKKVPDKKDEIVKSETDEPVKVPTRGKKAKVVEQNHKEEKDTSSKSANKVSKTTTTKLTTNGVKVEDDGRRRSGRLRN